VDALDGGEADAAAVEDDRSDLASLTCATHLVQNNANIRHVQEMLGHRSLGTTERYLRLTITDLKEAHTRCHPREQEQDGHQPTKPRKPSRR